MLALDLIPHLHFRAHARAHHRPNHSTNISHSNHLATPSPKAHKPPQTKPPQTKPPWLSPNPMSIDRDAGSEMFPPEGFRVEAWHGCCCPVAYFLGRSEGG